MTPPLFGWTPKYETNLRRLGRALDILRAAAASGTLCDGEAIDGTRGAALLLDRALKAQTAYKTGELRQER